MSVLPPDPPQIQCQQKERPDCVVESICETLTPRNYADYIVEHGRDASVKFYTASSKTPRHEGALSALVKLTTRCKASVKQYQSLSQSSNPTPVKKRRVASPVAASLPLKASCAKSAETCVLFEPSPTTSPASPSPTKPKKILEEVLVMEEKQGGSRGRKVNTTTKATSIGVGRECNVDARHSANKEQMNDSPHIANPERKNKRTSPAQPELPHLHSAAHKSDAVHAAQHTDTRQQNELTGRAGRASRLAAAAASETFSTSNLDSTNFQIASLQQLQTNCHGDEFALEATPPHIRTSKKKRHDGGEAALRRLVLTAQPTVEEGRRRYTRIPSPRNPVAPDLDVPRGPQQEKKSDLEVTRGRKKLTASHHWRPRGSSRYARPTKNTTSR